MKQRQQISEDHNDLHSVHKSSVSKPLKMKSIASLTPSGPPQPKVYKVKPIHFRELVQKLTGAQPELLLQHQQPQPKPHPKRSNNLQIVAPPPLPHQLQLQLNSQTDQTTISERPCKVEQDEKPFSGNSNNNKMMQDGVGTTEFIMSPNFQAWFSFAMLSPSHMDQRSHH